MSYLPSSSQGAHPLPTTTGGSSGGGGPVAEYLPTVEQDECYDVVEVERVVTAPRPQQPPKNPTITKLEVRNKLCNFYTVHWKPFDGDRVYNLESYFLNCR